MFLKELKLVNFKNYAEQKISFRTKVNLIYGENGSGKTNFLDALNCLSVTKSYFHISDKDLIRDSSDFFRLEGTIVKDDQENTIVIKYKLGGHKVIQVNQVTLDSMSDLIGRFPIVFIAPDDQKIVKDASQVRRAFIDRILCQSNHQYLKTLVKYNRILKQKNVVLKSAGVPNRNLLMTYNQSLLDLGHYIYSERALFTEEFSEDLKSLYHSIADGKEEVQVFYHSQYGNEDMAGLFVQSMEDEIFRRRPLIGIQRDEFEFLIQGKPLKKFGSQGQIKSFLYAMRISEFFFLKRVINQTPILVLDDFFEKLDNKRLEQLMELINGDIFEQVFVSDTELERSNKILLEKAIQFTPYEVCDGSITLT